MDCGGRYAAGRLTVWELGEAARELWAHGPDQSAAAAIRVRVEAAAGLVLAGHRNGTVAGYDLRTGQ